MFLQVIRNRLFAVLVTLAMEAALSAPSLAAGVRAGTVIENAATASFEAAGAQSTITSNTVALLVGEVIDVTASSRDAGPIAASQNHAVLTFELTNLGNGPESFLLTADPAVAGNDFDTSVTGIAVDSNGNGTYDPGVDAILPAPQATGMMIPDQLLTTFVLLDVPDGPTDGQRSKVSLLATAATGEGAAGTTFVGSGVGGGDAIVGSTGASARATGEVMSGITTVTLSKSATFADPYGGASPMRGGRITFALTAEVVGNGSVSDLSITDAIPLGTTYAPGSLALDGSPLSDGIGDDPGAADANGIAVAIDRAMGGTSHLITFAVTIN